MIPHTDLDIDPWRQENIDPGTESDHSEDLPLLEVITLPGVTNNPPGDNARNLYEKDLEAVP